LAAEQLLFRDSAVKARRGRARFQAYEGWKYTLVTIQREGEQHMAVGGGAGRIVVSATGSSSSNRSKSTNQMR
jgi:hypothetical protein